MVVIITNREQRAVNLRMQGLEAAAHELWEAGILGDIGDGDIGVLEGAIRTAGGQDLDTSFSEDAGKAEEAVFVGHGYEGAADRDEAGVFGVRFGVRGGGGRLHWSGGRGRRVESGFGGAVRGGAATRARNVASPGDWGPTGARGTGLGASSEGERGCRCEGSGHSGMQCLDDFVAVKEKGCLTRERG